MEWKEKERLDESCTLFAFGREFYASYYEIPICFFLINGNVNMQCVTLLCTCGDDEAMPDFDWNLNRSKTTSVAKREC